MPISSVTPHHLHLHLLGSPSQSIDGDEVTGFRSTKTRALLYYLAETGKTHTRDSLAALFWPTFNESKANNSLRNALSSLRKVLPGYLHIEGQRIALNHERIWLDTRQFMHLLQETDDATAAIQQCQAAITLYTGDFLEGFHVDDAPDFELWITMRREAFHQTLVHALMQLARWYAQHNDATASLATLSRLLTMAPGHEAAHRLTMQVLANTGQRAAALLQFDACRRYLVEELGVDPAPETMALYTQLLEGERIEQAPADAPPIPGLHSSARVHIDRGDMPGRLPLHGRLDQLAMVTKWLAQERATLIVISGMGGIGKTALAAELARRLAEADEAPRGFRRIIWRSLINAPTLSSLLDDWLRTFQQGPAERPPQELDAKLALLFAELERQRALLILDNVESIMNIGDSAGKFRPGFEGYHRLLERIVHGRHQSCLLITTRDVPRGIRRLAQDYAHVRHLPLTGLLPAEGMALLSQHALKGASTALRSLVDHYSGNPLALKLVAATVNELYAGDANAFWRDGAVVIDDMRAVLEQQFDRLSPLAQDLLVWLAVNRKPVAFDELRNDLVVVRAQREFVEAIRLLRRSSLLQESPATEAGITVDEGTRTRLALQNVVMEYVADRLLGTLQLELDEGKVDYFHRYTLLKVSLPEYVQAVQKRLLLAPLAEWAVRQYGASGVQQRLRSLLDYARQHPALAGGYTATNVVHLMLQRSSTLQGENFAGLSLRQADLRAATLIDVDLRHAALGHTRFTNSFGIVSSVAVSTDGQFVAAGAGRSLVIWQLDSAQPYMVFEEHPSEIADIAFAPDGQHLASVGFDGTLFLWDMAVGAPVARKQLQLGTLLSLAFSPDGETLVCGGYGGRIGVLKWRRNELVGALTPNTRILRLVFAPTGELLANVGYHGMIQVWDIQTQKIIYTLENDSHMYVAHAEMAVGSTLIWTHQADTIFAWDRETRAVAFVLHGDQAWVDSLALSPDEQQLASADAEGAITLWDTHTRQPLRFLVGHEGSVRTLTYTPDGRHLISGGYDETVRIWDVQSGLEEKHLQGYFHWIYKLAISPNGQWVAGVTLTGAVHFWRNQDLGEHRSSQGGKSAIRALAFSPNSKLLATGGDDGRVIVWDVESGARRHLFQEHTQYVRTVAFGPQGRYLASSSFDCTIRLWDVERGQLLRTIPLASIGDMDCMAFHPHHALFAYGDASNHLYLWDAENGRIAMRVEMASQPKTVAFSPHGRYLACGTYDGAVTIWAFVGQDSGFQLVECWRIHASPQNAWQLVFSRDEAHLAWNGEQKEIYVAAIEKGDIRYSIPGTHLATCIAFSADGQHLVSDDADFSVLIHHALTGTVDKRWTSHRSKLTCIVADPTSSTIATSDAAGIVQLWDVTTGAMLATTGLNGPYLGTNITGATGLTQGQRQSLLALGAVADS